MIDDHLAALRAPFPPATVLWRVGAMNAEKTRGLALAYIDARDVQDRLDEVFGFRWQVRHHHCGGEKLACDIGVKIGDEWFWRGDGAGATDVEAEKGAFSDSFKRAAVRWGIGRYLYETPSPWVELEPKGKSYIIPERELTRLRALLSRPTATGSHSTPSTNHADLPPKVRRAQEARDRIKRAINNAVLPTLIDEIMSINAADMELIKEVYEPTYRALEELALARKNEMYASA